MKVECEGLRGDQRLSFVTLFLVSATVFVWTWKRGLIHGNQQFQLTLTPDGIPVAAVRGKVVAAAGSIEIGNGENNNNNNNKESQREGSDNYEQETTPTNEETYSINRSAVTVCNYANGKWVVDGNQTLYSGFGCKQWLRSSWSCRLSRRPDFSYENLRWQPKDCSLERFEGSNFLKRLQNKTLAFVGDSLGKQQFQSLICMITGGKQRDDIIKIRKKYGRYSEALWFRSTNTTILYYCSTSLCDVQPMNKTNPYTDYAIHLDRPTSFLTKYIRKIDVLVLNTMHHWNQGKFKANRWVTHVGGVPNSKQIDQARNLAVHNIIDWANKQLAKYVNLKVFYRSMSPRHFLGGDWNTGGSCDNTTSLVAKEIVQERPSDLVAASAVKGTKVKLLDITALTRARGDAHISRYHGVHISTSSDCSHWCLPGVPDTWNEILFAQL